MKISIAALMSICFCTVAQAQAPIGGGMNPFNTRGELNCYSSIESLSNSIVTLTKSGQIKVMSSHPGFLSQEERNGILTIKLLQPYGFYGDVKKFVSTIRVEMNQSKKTVSKIEFVNDPKMVVEINEQSKKMAEFAGLGSRQPIQNTKYSETFVVDANGKCVKTSEATETIPEPNQAMGSKQYSFDRKLCEELMPLYSKLAAQTECQDLRSKIDATFRRRAQELAKENQELLTSIQPSSGNLGMGFGTYGPSAHAGFSELMYWSLPVSCQQHGVRLDHKVSQRAATTMGEIAPQIDTKEKKAK